MRILRAAVAVVPSVFALGCDPIPYAQIDLTPATRDAAFQADSARAIAARVLGRRGFAALSHTCAESGHPFRRQVPDSGLQAHGPVTLDVCVTAESRHAKARFAEERLGGTLLPASTVLVQELADSLRGLGRVHIDTR